ncbi:hypothetical protein [Pelosinus baikalensis]|uniref:Uncharacterized protein n=1 Tax=Pelosinus baikalensis TaxID=2892015 RepID=A0ABS8HXW2_9FIRM|nr:hypothetical protein [Pelosinus baikalensis]MCC5468022.1 hypothetical protein [Pelosinus baikalensis]
MAYSKISQSDAAENIYSAYKFWKDLALLYMARCGNEIADEYQSLDKEERSKMAEKEFIRIIKRKEE